MYSDYDAAGEYLIILSAFCNNVKFDFVLIGDVIGATAEVKTHVSVYLIPMHIVRFKFDYSKRVVITSVNNQFYNILP